MTKTRHPAEDQPSLENLVESGLITLESLHPGGLELTGELASMCGITADTKVLDVACGTGETARHLAANLGAKVWGIDRSSRLLDRTRDKAEAVGLNVTFCAGDAEALPFFDAAFDVAICECTLCLLDKSAALREMARVVRVGGIVGMHDLFWRECASEDLKETLARIEGEEPETLEGWQQQFAEVGLVDVQAVDRSELKKRWMRDTRAQLGLSGYLRLVLYVIRRWGIAGLYAVLRSERVFSSSGLGYAIVLGKKP